MHNAARQMMLDRVARGLPMLAALERQVFDLPDFHFHSMPVDSDDSVVNDWLGATELAAEALRGVPIEAVAAVITDLLFRLHGDGAYSAKDEHDCKLLLEHFAELVEAADFVGPPPPPVVQRRFLRLVS